MDIQGLGAILGSLVFAQAAPSDGIVDVLQNKSFIVFTFLTLIIVIPSLAHYWHLTRVKELDASLKHEMLQRGFSADEIASVISAGKKRARPSESSVPAGEAATISPQSTFS